MDGEAETKATRRATERRVTAFQCVTVCREDTGLGTGAPVGVEGGLGKASVLWGLRLYKDGQSFAILNGELMK